VETAWRWIPPSCAWFRSTGSGGADASSGPRNDQEFAPVESSDQANAMLLLLNHLGIAQVEAVVGASYGVALPSTWPGCSAIA
jgi:homoserine acetyltransferase